MFNYADIQPYVILVEYILSELAAVLSFVMLTRVLYYCFWRRFRFFEISIPMKIYLITEFIYSWGTWLYVGYLLFWWKTGTQNYNAYILWTLGGFQGSFLVMKPVTVFYLGLDRCLSIFFPIKYRGTRVKWIIPPLALSVAIFFTNGFLFYVWPSFPSSSVTTCGAFLCLGPNSVGTAYTVLRYTSSSGIVIVSIVLYFGVKKHLFDHSAAAKCTKLACKTVLLSFFLDFTPHLITFALYTFFGFNIAVYCGPYSTFFSTMECFGCSLIYHNTMKGQNVNNKVKSTISLMIPSFSNHHKPITTAFVQSHNTPPISLHQHIAITTVHH